MDLLFIQYIILIYYLSNKDNSDGIDGLFMDLPFANVLHSYSKWPLKLVSVSIKSGDFS